MKHSERIQKLMGRMRKAPLDTNNPASYPKAPYHGKVQFSDSKNSTGGFSSNPTQKNAYQPNHSTSKSKSRNPPPMDDLIFSGFENNANHSSADKKYTRTQNSFTRDPSRSRSREIVNNRIRIQNYPEALLLKRREITGGSEFLDDSRSMEYIYDTKGSKSALSYDEPSEKTLKLDYAEIDGQVRGVDLKSYEHAKGGNENGSKLQRKKVHIPHFNEPLDNLLKTLPKEGNNLGQDPRKEDLSTERFKGENSMTNTRPINPLMLNSSENINSTKEIPSISNPSNFMQPKDLKIKQRSSNSQLGFSGQTDPKTLSIKKRYHNYLHRNQYPNQHHQISGQVTKNVSRSRSRNIQEMVNRDLSPSSLSKFRFESSREGFLNAMKNSFEDSEGFLNTLQQKNSAQKTDRARSKNSATPNTNANYQPIKSSNKKHSTSRPRTGGGYLVKEKTRKLENLNKSYRVLQMSMAMTKTTMRDTSMNHTNNSIMERTYNEGSRGLGPTPDARSKSVFDERTAGPMDGNFDGEIKAKISSLTKKNKNLLAMQGNVDDSIRENFCKLWNLTRPNTRDCKNPDDQTMKINLEEIDLDFEHTKTLIDFGTTTISKILSKKDIENLPEKSRRNPSACSKKSRDSKKSLRDPELGPERGFITGQKELVSHIVQNIRADMGLPFMINENPLKTWQQFINQHELENLTNNPLHQRLLENCVKSGLKFCKDDLTKLKELSKHPQNPHSQKSGFNLDFYNLLYTQKEILSLLKGLIEKSKFIKNELKENVSKQKLLKVDKLKFAMKDKRVAQNYSKVENYLTQERELLKRQKLELSEKEKYLQNKQDKIRTQKDELSLLKQEEYDQAKERIFLLKQQEIRAEKEKICKIKDQEMDSEKKKILLLKEEELQAERQKLLLLKEEEISLERQKILELKEKELETEKLKIFEQKEIELKQETDRIVALKKVELEAETAKLNSLKDAEIQAAREKMDILGNEQLQAQKKKILEEVETQLKQETQKMRETNLEAFEKAKKEILLEQEKHLQKERQILTDEKNLELARERDQIVREKDQELKGKTEELLEWMQAEQNQEKSKLSMQQDQVSAEKKRVEDLETQQITLDNEKRLLLCENKFDEKLVSEKKKNCRSKGK